MLRVEDRHLVRLITLDRPNKSNALSPGLISRLQDVLDETEADPDFRIVVLTGAGKHFCAGLDLEHLAQLDAAAKVEYMRSVFSVFRLQSGRIDDGEADGESAGSEVVGAA